MVILTEFLPSSSSPSEDEDHRHNHKFDVFLSFRGADTRNGFTDHLYNTLLDAGINTFLDDEEIETGEPLKPELESAIKSSRASIIVLSKNYASSTWCLDELALILDQKRNVNQLVIPIFYHVDPTNVRKQKSSFGEAMANHKRRMEEEKDAEKRSKLAQKLELWHKALIAVADLKGKDAKDRKETEFIKEVVTDVHSRLGVPLSNLLPLLIGRDDYIESITSWLTDGSGHAANMLTIAGMGGIGKTSLAKYVFHLHKGKFSKSSFLEGINTRCNEQYNGLLDLQKQLHGDISKKFSIQVNDVLVYTSKIEKALSSKTVFVVLDDIDSLEQLDALLGREGLHPGSKILITTKDASLTERSALFNPHFQPKHRKVLLTSLSKNESLELLCIHAFKSKNPKEGYKEVSEKLVNYCDGHPLALEILGRSLYKRELAYWGECIQGLKKEPHSRIKKALQMSFDSLPLKNDKDLFKHIACFFVGIDKESTETILGACYINTRSGITNLTDKCLLGISMNNKLTMHQLVQEMGRDLVRQESPDKPRKRSRLWCHEESFKVLEGKKGAYNLLGLALDMRMLDKEQLRGSFELRTDSLSKMDNLMLLQLNYVQINGCFDNFPKELRWLCMHGFPFKSIPSDLPTKNLVALDMSYSNIESLGMCYTDPQLETRQKKLNGSCSNDKQLLGSLKILDLSFCEKLHSLGGFSGFPALERLIVKNCISLIEVCESIEQCVELVLIDLSYCYKLKKPISIGGLKKIKALLLDGCNSVESLIEMRDMNASDVSLNSKTSSSSSMEAIPSDFKFFTVPLPSSLILLSLTNNNLSNESFPMDFSCLSMLEKLFLDHNPIVSMPDCVRSLPRLEELSMQHCKMMTSIENPPPTLRYLSTHRDLECSLRKIKFGKKMSQLIFSATWKPSSASSFEIDGMIKIQPMVDVDEKILHSLGWKSLEVIEGSHIKASNFLPLLSSSTQVPLMYYEFGVFSTIYEGKRMPKWLCYRSKGASISFTIPTSPKKLRGLNFCCVVMKTVPNPFTMPAIKISNITQNHIWIYDHYVNFVESGGKCISLLSHWMFGPNELIGGDKITVTVKTAGLTDADAQVIKNCGMRLVYDDGKIEEEEDVLGYYKSWNHIIGGDLSSFKVTTGEYYLDHMRFMNIERSYEPPSIPVIGYEVKYKATWMLFKAFSQKKSEIVGRDLIKSKELQHEKATVDGNGVSSLDKQG